MSYLSRAVVLLCLVVLLCPVILASGGCGWRLQLGVAQASSIPLPGPPRPESTPPPAAADNEPFYKAWWFWGAIGLAAMGGAAAVVAVNTGGTDRMVVGRDGRFDTASFSNR